MNSVPLPLDISSNKALVKLAKEVRKTNTPRALIQDDETLAVLVPAEPSSSLKKRTWKDRAAIFGSWHDVDADAMIATIYRWREEGSRPATRPT